MRDSKTDPFIKRTKTSYWNDRGRKRQLSNKTKQKGTRETDIVVWGRTGHSKDDYSVDGPLNLEGIIYKRRKENTESLRIETEAGNSLVNTIQNPLWVNSN